MICKIRKYKLVIHPIHYSNQKYLISLLENAGILNGVEGASPLASERSVTQTIEHLLEASILTEWDIAQTLGAQLDLPLHTLHEVSYLSSTSSKGLTITEIQRYQATVIEQVSGRFSIAIVDPLNLETIDALSYLLGAPLTLYITTPSALRDLIERASIALEPTLQQELPPTIQLVDQLLHEGVAQGASDIHLEPLQHVLRVRYRIDGRLQVVATHPSQLSAEIIARIKVMTDSMQMAEKRHPQDGRLQIRYKEREVDFRVSSLPSHHGETIVMRILDHTTVRLGMPNMGLSNEDLRSFTSLAQSPDGMILVTGPTGAGKTTTLYSCLDMLNESDRKIITVEDPVEYQVAGINQVMVRPEIGMTFASALRAMLRQAPNIIMVGEIRDLETASISINASLTGHLVFSTLHTNDATSAVARLENIGVKRFLIASGVRAIMAQRLVRRLCEVCKESVELTSPHLNTLRLSSVPEGSNLYQPKGCEKCRQTGYSGRVGLFELFVLDDETKLSINEGVSSMVLRQKARAQGMKTLWDDGVEKVLRGDTSISELLITLIPAA